MLCVTRHHMESSKCVVENQRDASSQLSSFPCKEILVRSVIILVAVGFSLFQDMPCGPKCNVSTSSMHDFILDGYCSGHAKFCVQRVSNHLCACKCEILVLLSWLLIFAKQCFYNVYYSHMSLLS